MRKLQRWMHEAILRHETVEAIRVDDPHKARRRWVDICSCGEVW